ncbi:MAG: P27 family phage terminase small subunit [Clostridium sp.]|nr:P27 family phage terminase small subunit [Clostridium sp.]
MKASGWVRKIKEQCQLVGTYKPAFEPVIKALADILEQRDNAYAEFLASGGESCITKISDRGAVNVGKNPRLQVWGDLNAQALAYWRDLGLTPAGLKKIDEQSMKPKKVSALTEALRDLAG